MARRRLITVLAVVAFADAAPDRRADAAWALGALGPDAAAAGADLLPAARESGSPDRAATFRDTARRVAPDAVVAAHEPTRAYQRTNV
jgi:hypothetical protein